MCLLYNMLHTEQQKKILLDNIREREYNLDISERDFVTLLSRVNDSFRCFVHITSHSRGNFSGQEGGTRGNIRDPLIPFARRLIMRFVS